jgi:hypothetical protein
MRKTKVTIIENNFVFVEQLTKEHSFLDFIFGGMQINFTVSFLSLSLLFLLKL